MYSQYRTERRQEAFSFAKPPALELHEQEHQRIKSHLENAFIVHIGKYQSSMGTGLPRFQISLAINSQTYYWLPDKTAVFLTLL